jgi:hypothetical protein
MNKDSQRSSLLEMNLLLYDNHLFFTSPLCCHSFLVERTVRGDFLLTTRSNLFADKLEAWSLWAVCSPLACGSY